MVIVKKMHGTQFRIDTNLLKIGIIFLIYSEYLTVDRNIFQTIVEIKGSYSQDIIPLDIFKWLNLFSIKALLYCWSKEKKPGNAFYKRLID